MRPVAVEAQQDGLGILGIQTQGIAGGAGLFAQVDLAGGVDLEQRHGAGHIVGGQVFGLHIAYQVADAHLGEAVIQRAEHFHIDAVVVLAQGRAVGGGLAAQVQAVARIGDGVAGGHGDVPAGGYVGANGAVVPVGIGGGGAGGNGLAGDASLGHEADQAAYLHKVPAVHIAQYLHLRAVGIQAQQVAVIGHEGGGGAQQHALALAALQAHDGGGGLDGVVDEVHLQEGALHIAGVILAHADGIDGDFSPGGVIEGGYDADIGAIVELANCSSAVAGAFAQGDVLGRGMADHGESIAAIRQRGSGE